VRFSLSVETGLAQVVFGSNPDSPSALKDHTWASLSRSLKLLVAAANFHFASVLISSAAPLMC
jgi:hypothetical protein